jgi:hypothetical protein
MAEKGGGGGDAALALVLMLMLHERLAPTTAAPTSTQAGRGLLAFAVGVTNKKNFETSKAPKPPLAGTLTADGVHVRVPAAVHDHAVGTDGGRTHLSTLQPRDEGKGPTHTTATNTT